MAGRKGLTDPINTGGRVMDGEGNLRAADIGITCLQGNLRAADIGITCLHPICQDTEKIEGTRLRRLRRPHRRHVIQMVKFTDPLRKYAKDTDRPRPSKDSTTNPSTGRRGFVISGRLQTFMVGTKIRGRYN